MREIGELARFCWLALSVAIALPTAVIYTAWYMRRCVTGKFARIKPQDALCGADDLD